MACHENNDEIEHLRLLALKSMVRRSKNKSSDHEVFDEDIKLLRAEALKTMNRKRNTQNNSLVNKDEKHVKIQIVNEQKRSIDDLSSFRNKKIIKLNENRTTDSKDLSNYSYIKKSSGVLKDDHKQEFKHKPKLKCNIKSQVEYTAESHNKVAINDSKGNFKKTVRNGCMQLSNLDSDKIDETMIVTLNLSESDDLSSEYDLIMNEVFPNNNEFITLKCFDYFYFYVLGCNTENQI